MKNRGYVVLVGQGFPARISLDNWAIAWFPTRSAAEQWISDNPKAKTPEVEELQG